MRGRTLGHRKEFMTGLLLGIMIIALSVMLTHPLPGERYGAPSTSLAQVTEVVPPQSLPQETIARSESRAPQAEGTSPSETRPVFPREQAPQRVSTLAVAECCGPFVWAGRDWLLVYDEQPYPGAWLVNVVSGERRWIAAWFGLPAGDIIAVRNPHSRRTELYSWDGSVEASIDTGESLALLDPTGRWAVWSVVEEQTVPSSAVSRVARLFVLDRWTGETRTLGRLRVSALAWTSDGSRLLLIGSLPDGSRLGVWRVTPAEGAVDLIVPGHFFTNLQVIPGTHTALVTRVLSGDPEEDGVWLIEVDRGTARRAPFVLQYRAAREFIWVLELGKERDRVFGYRWPDLEICVQHELGGHVLGDVWEIEPDSSWIAYWREEDRRVIVEVLEACSSHR